MKQEKNGKTLYHVQSVTDWHDEPYDMFVWANNESDVTKNLKKLYLDDFGGELGKSELKDLIEYSNVYTVYAEEL